MIRKIASVLAIVLPTVASADERGFELSVYTGIQTSPHSIITGTDPDAGGAVDFTAGWDGRSFEMPPYYGVRATWWRNSAWGFGAEFTHAKVYADAQTLTDNGYDRLEFTDGLNFLTANATYRWSDGWLDGKLTPYAGGGVGIALPHADIQAGGGDHTFGYQLTGPAARVYGGVVYDLKGQWDLMVEYQFTYSSHDVELENGGNLSTDLITNALNFGVTRRF